MIPMLPWRPLARGISKLTEVERSTNRKKVSKLGLSEVVVQMEKLEKLLNYVKVPAARDKVYRDECVYTFDSPESEGGLYIDLTTFIGVSEDMLDIHYAKTGNPLYLHLKKVKLPLPKEASAEPEPKVTRLAIGLEGGFSPASKPKYQYEEHNSLFILPDRYSIKMPCPELPEKVQEAIAGILAADTASYKAEVEATEWNGEQRVISKYAADLVQLDNGVKVPPNDWQCQRCDLTTNLWLNLTDGSILCGRKFFDGTGGNNHAVDYYAEKGYPLAVKLGTITSDGKADVYSYPEDDMVEDPFLAKHLSHFGINAATMEKTEKSMAELEVSLNQRIGEWSTIQESGTKLQPLYGPGYTGLQNLGNSCYMNSVLQILFTIPDFQRKYFESALESFRNSMIDPTEDFNAQTSKVAFGLLSGRYSEQPKEEVEDQDEAQPGIRPIVYKNLIGKGHPEFSTKRQQDAQEFLLHMINLVERHSRGSVNPSDCFKFKIEDRIECGQSHKVRYSERDEYCLPLSVPMDLVTNHAELAEYERRKQEEESRGEKMEGEPVRPHFTLISLLDSFTQPEKVQQFYSTAIKEKTVAYKSTKFATFPDYLAIQLRKFTLTEDWRPVKLDISVSVPEKLDISFLKGRGLQTGEEELPSDVQVPEFTYDPATMEGLVDMGFPVEGCKRSIYFTGNKGLEPAAMWAMEHMGDADFDQPFVIPGSATKKKQDEFIPNEEAIAMIEGMGFSRTQAITALKATDNHIERAVDWIFSHPDEISASDSSVPVPSEPAYRDGPGKYELVAFVSHMGTSTSCGHYVCHIKKDGRWVIFNDNKVALSEHPPIELGYLYFFKRISE